MSGRKITRLIQIGAIVTCLHGASRAQTQFVAPPRTITDIVAILDAEKPDPARLAKLRAAAEAAPPSEKNALVLANFYQSRAQSRSSFGDFAGALADARRAVEYGRTSMEPRRFAAVRSFLAASYDIAGFPKEALAVSQQNEKLFDRPGVQGWLFPTFSIAARLSLQLGDDALAEVFLRKAERLFMQARDWPTFPEFRENWEIDVERVKLELLLRRNKFTEAEKVGTRILNLYNNVIGKRGAKGLAERTQDANDRGWNYVTWRMGMAKAVQGKLAEGEADVRRALLNALAATGKNNLTTVGISVQLARFLLQAGRRAEAVLLLRRSVEIFDEIGLAKDSQPFVAALILLSSALQIDSKHQEAQPILDRIAEATRNWDSERRDNMLYANTVVSAALNTENPEDGIAAVRRILEFRQKKFGANNQDTAIARGWYAVGLARAGRNEQARSEFEASMPILLANSRGGDDTSGVNLAERNRRVAPIIAGYLELNSSTMNAESAARTFPLADLLRGRNVQRALNASSVRASVGSPATAALLRRAQDLEKQVTAQFATLNNLLAKSSTERDDSVVRNLRQEIDQLTKMRDAVRKEINSKVAGYDDLVDSRPTNVAEIQQLLGADEAFISFYFGPRLAFVWAIPKKGAIQFVRLNTNIGEIEHKIGELRRSLEQNVASIAEIEPYNLALAHELYETLLKPIEQSWKPARHIIVVTNGALGLLPLGLLPVTPSAVQTNQQPLFGEYKNVAWLARTHSVTMMPSNAALRTLRELPAAPANREKLIGFGDPVFASVQAINVQDGENLFSGNVITRGLPFKRRATVQTRSLDSADISMLPQLPDTADELKSIASALGADPGTSLHLGRFANEQAVLSADLSRYKIVAFATHGLVSGDLNGLYQPALALSSPSITGDGGDGLLTMDKILGLRLNADWVVLSACNTAAGATAGSEANSGLASAFFYAGTRAVLVTNWSVHSASARELVGELFRIQQEHKSVSRAEALRLSMMNLLDGKGYTDEKGETQFSYAHPLFWAPYSIIGDGAAAN